MFDRVISLIGEEKFSKLQRIKVLIVGIGGVGGYALEALVRTGVINIDIVDFDKVDITNLNRQIITNQNNIDEKKVKEAYDRAIGINPDVNINTYDIFLDSNNIDNLLENKYDYIIDACDSVNTKVELIKKCIEYNIELISCMGTAKKIDPTKLSITTLEKTNYDPLAKILRKKIKDLNIRLNKVIVVSSTEKIIECNSLGSLVIVPATAGLLCAKYVIDSAIID